MARISAESREAARILALAAAVFAVSRGALFAFDYVGIHLVPKFGVCRPQWEVFGAGNDFWNGFFRWDSGWYEYIAKDGYRFRSDQTSSVAFYPLMPYLARWLGHVLGGTSVAALVITNTASVGAVYYLYRLGDLFFSRDVLHRSVALFLAFPTSFFLSAFYTEALFLCFATASMFHFYRERYVASGLLGALAMLARSSGLVLFLALAADLAVRLATKRVRFRWSMLALSLVPGGLVVFMLILKVQVGDPFAFAKAMQFWGRKNVLPWTPLLDAVRDLRGGFPTQFEKVQEVLDALTAIGFLAVGAATVRRRFPVAFSAYVLLGVLVPLMTYNLASMGRYVLVLFPAFYWLGVVTERRPALERLLLCSSAFFLAVYSLRFMRCGWAG